MATATTGLISSLKIGQSIAFNEKEIAKWDEQELAFGDYSPGRFGWLLSDPLAFAEPIPAKGKLGIWEFDMPISLPYEEVPCNCCQGGGCPVCGGGGFLIIPKSSHP